MSFPDESTHVVHHFALALAGLDKHLVGDVLGAAVEPLVLGIADDGQFIGDDVALAPFQHFGEVLDVVGDDDGCFQVVVVGKLFDAFVFITHLFPR